ncbi:MAG: TIR domain-containing protein [Symploca sp. SIO2E9]|nr:TIR domain-containing protein [Symploca sp. SIO2E9]
MTSRQQYPPTPNQNSFFDAFISYGRKDSKDFASKLHKRLTEIGFKVWFDQHDIPPAVDWQNQIDDGIEHSHNFLFIIAPHAVKSANCLKEIKQAIKCNKRIIPLVHIEPSDCLDQMHPIISKTNWIYFQEGINDFEEAWEKLVNSIRHHADYVEQHTRFLVKALEWQRNQQQTNYLLIQSEYFQAESWLRVRFKDEQPPCEPTDLHCEFICESTKNANNLMSEVFISYSDKDKDIRGKIGKTLMRQGLTIWTPEADIKTGIEFQEAINQGIEEADNFVYLISTSSLQSKYCQQELEYAFANNKRLIPLLLEAIDIKPMSPLIRGLQFIDFRGHEDEKKYRLSAAKLLKELYQDACYYQEHKTLLVKALKWQRQNRNRSLLLRGHHLQHYQNWLKVHRQRAEHPPLPLHQEFIAASAHQPTELSQEVFISYSRADSDFARKLNDALQLQGKTTWFDQESIPPGSDFQQEIYRGIESSDNFLFIISPKSVNSPYCDDEVEYAQKLNKRFVTVVCSEVSAPELHSALRRVQWIDFKRHGGDFYVNFSELIRTLDTDREHVHYHTKWLQRSLEWKQQGKSSDLLLRGSECSLAENWLLEAEQDDKQPAPVDVQTDFIRASQEAILANIKLEKRRTMILKSLLGLVSVAFLGAVGFGIVAFSQYRRAEQGEISALTQASEANFVASSNSLDALLSGLEAGKKVEQASVKSDSKLYKEVVKVLGQAVYWVRERNRLEGHLDAIQSVSFSPDGEIIATASYDKRVKLWNREGRLIRILEGHQGAVMGVSFSPDSQMLATVSLDTTTKLWSLNGKLLNTLQGHKDYVVSVSFSPDGQTIATAGHDQEVKLWSLDGKWQNTLKGHTDTVWAVRFGPDGKLLATAGEDSTVKLWNLQGQEITTLKGHTGGIIDISFSPDGQTLATAGRDKTVKLWNWSQDKRKFTLEGHTDRILSVRFSPDGKTIATASRDNTVKLWNLEGNEIATLEGHQSRVNSLSFSQDGSILASASSDKTVKLWQFDPLWLNVLSGHQGNIDSVRFSPDGNLLASVGDDRTVKLWSRDGQLLRDLQGHRDSLSSVSFSPDNKLLASAGDDGIVKLWSRDGQLLRDLQGHTDVVRDVSFSPDSKLLASAGDDGTVKLWSRDGKLLGDFVKIKDDTGIRCVSFSPDGQIIAIANDDGIVKLWDRQGKEIADLKGHKASVYQVSFSPDGHTIATASEDNTVKLWEQQGKEIATLKGHTAAVWEVSFSHRGQMLATASNDKTVKLWHRDGRLITTLSGHTNEVYSVSFSPDGKTLASASSDSRIILWNIENLNLDELLERGCTWVQDYLKNNPNAKDKKLCD